MQSIYGTRGMAVAPTPWQRNRPLTCCAKEGTPWKR